MSQVNRSKQVNRAFVLEAYKLNPLHTAGAGEVDKQLIVGATRAEQEVHRKALDGHHSHNRLEHSLETEMVGDVERFTDQACEHLLQEISRTVTA